jgi:phosphoglycerol transferase MdoB-like AlkP superfamily enzyme
MTSPGALVRHVLAPAGHERFVPRWLPLGFVGAAVLLVPWSALLLFTLPRDAHASHWALAWTGFDLAMMVALFCTAFFSLRQSMLTVFWATMTGTITMVDAWFDVLTSRGHVEQTSAIVLAIVGEIPLTIVSFWWARRILRALDDAIPQLRTEGWRLHHGRLVPPATDRPPDTDAGKLTVETQ